RAETNLPAQPAAQHQPSAQATHASPHQPTAPQNAPPPTAEAPARRHPPTRTNPTHAQSASTATPQRPPHARTPRPPHAHAAPQPAPSRASQPQPQAHPAPDNGTPGPNETAPLQQQHSLSFHRSKVPLLPSGYSVLVCAVCRSKTASGLLSSCLCR